MRSKTEDLFQDQSLYRMSLNEIRSEKLSLVLLYFTFITGVVFLISDYQSSGFLSAQFLTQFVSVSIYSIWFLFDQVFFRNKIKGKHRIYFLIFMALVHLPNRYLVFDSVFSPPLLWYLIVPCLSTYFLNGRFATGIQAFIFFQVFCLVIIIKTESYAPFVMKDFSSLEINGLFGWFFLSFVFVFFFNKIESYRIKYEKMLIRRIQEDVNTARLSSLGEMAGSIAHEINNPLQVIKGNLEIISRLTDKENLDERETGRLQKSLLQSKKTVDRISYMTSTMLTLGKRNGEEEQPITNFEDSFETAWTFVESKLEEYNISFAVDKNLLHVKVRAHPTKLGQVLINLFSNSIYATQVLGERRIWIEGEQKKDRLYLYFRDSGKGIEDSIADRMFQPFFSTKPDGYGTGFGLAICRTLLLSMGGDIKYVRDDSNTCFCLEIPLGSV